MESEKAYKRTLPITDRIFIPEDEVYYTASRSSGSGGQNVNKVSTRVTLWFDVLSSPSLTEGEKQLILKRLSTRINKSGKLWINAQETRSQAENRELARRRFIELVSKALTRSKPRKKTRVPQSIQEERIFEKKRRSRLKMNRGRVFQGTEN
ncbi:MAG: alternative ribosome rescue aminoacyl-tRNA hydrolase ArfB [Thermodesulfobacteriota bacterium]